MKIINCVYFTAPLSLSLATVGRAAGQSPWPRLKICISLRKATITNLDRKNSQLTYEVQACCVKYHGKIEINIIPCFAEKWKYETSAGFLVPNLFCEVHRNTMHVALQKFRYRIEWNGNFRKFCRKFGIKYLKFSVPFDILYSALVPLAVTEPA